MTKDLNVSWVGKRGEEAVLDVQLKNFEKEDAVWILRDMFHTAIMELDLPDTYSIRVLRAPKASLTAKAAQC